MESLRIPLFPLDVVLLPKKSLPLHIFEPRYKLMIRNAVEQDAPFGVVARAPSRADTRFVPALAAGRRYRPRRVHGARGAHHKNL